MIGHRHPGEPGGEIDLVQAEGNPQALDALGALLLALLGLLVDLADDRCCAQCSSSIPGTPR